jgi:hypothetical protein
MAEPPGIMTTRLKVSTRPPVTSPRMHIFKDFDII